MHPADGDMPGGRPVVTAQEAARVLGRDVRTVRRMIKDRELEGYARPGDKQRRWYVYSDQLRAESPQLADAGSGPSYVDALRTQNAALVEANSELRAQLVSERETTRLLMAANAMMRELLEGYRHSVAEMAAGAEGYRRAAEGYQESAYHFEKGAIGFQSTTDKMSSVVDSYADALSQHTTPGDLSGL